MTRVEDALPARLTSVVVVTPAPFEHAELAAEFPTVRITRAAAPPTPVTLDLADFLSAPTFAPFDDAIAAWSQGDQDVLVLRGDRDVPRGTMQVLTRYQRLVERTNTASRVPQYAQLRRAHLALHDLRKPLVKADLDHAIDAWQWLLRLAPEAGIEVQLAALLHDIERLASEADARIEQHAPSYQTFKDAHAREGACQAYELVRDSGFSDHVASRVRALVARHEQPSAERELALLNDADALSYFSLNSSGYIDYFGAPQTRKKIAYTLNRLSSAARPRLRFARLRPDVQALLDESSP